jgi:hypothetical protein
MQIRNKCASFSNEDLHYLLSVVSNSANTLLHEDSRYKNAKIE